MKDKRKRVIVVVVVIIGRRKDQLCNGINDSVQLRQELINKSPEEQQ